MYSMLIWGVAMRMWVLDLSSSFTMSVKLSQHQGSTLWYMAVCSCEEALGKADLLALRASEENVLPFEDSLFT